MIIVLVIIVARRASGVPVSLNRKTASTPSALAIGALIITYTILGGSLI